MSIASVSLGARRAVAGSVASLHNPLPMATAAGAGGDVHRVLYDAVALCSASCAQRTTTNPTMKGAATPVTVGLDEAPQPRFCAPLTREYTIGVLLLLLLLLVLLFYFYLYFLLLFFFGPRFLRFA